MCKVKEPKFVVFEKQVQVNWGLYCTEMDITICPINFNVDLRTKFNGIP